MTRAELRLLKNYIDMRVSELIDRMTRPEYVSKQRIDAEAELDEALVEDEKWAPEPPSPYELIDR